MARDTGSVSLEAAIRDKYCSCEGDGEGEERMLPARKQIKESAVYMRPGVCICSQQCGRIYCCSSTTPLQK